MDKFTELTDIEVAAISGAIGLVVEQYQNDKRLLALIDALAPIMKRISSAYTREELIAAMDEKYPR